VSHIFSSSFRGPALPLVEGTSFQPLTCSRSHSYFVFSSSVSAGSGSGWLVEVGEARGTFRGPEAEVASIAILSSCQAVSRV
jgi:hypothetical protein